MYIFLSDETNTDKSKSNNFFIYGGLILNVENFHELHSIIRVCREKAGFKIGDIFKHTYNEKPDYVEMEEFTLAKQKVIEACVKYDCKFIADIVHYEIVKNQDIYEIYDKSINHVLSRFNIFLEQKNDFGICLFDNLPINSNKRFISKKFSEGLSMKWGERINLENIYLYGFTSDNYSHINSAMDILLGSFRYCINDYEKTVVASKVVPNIISMSKLITEKDNNLDGIMIRPSNVVKKELRDEYNNLSAFLYTHGH